MIADRSGFSKVKRVVVKVGTSQLTDDKNMVVPERVKRIAAQLAELHKNGTEVLLVTSGAVGLGLGIIGASEYPKTLSERQALAAMGQSRLMHMYEVSFAKFGLRIGQVILTAQDIHTRERYINVRNTFLKLLEYKAIPIVNENDTVSVEEIKFGDNDTLSANVALCADADLLIILTDTDGLFDKNPKLHKDAKRIASVRKIDASLEALATGTDKVTAIGGMTTKLHAARIAAQAGIGMVIACGYDDNIIPDVLAGKDKGTYFVPSARGLSLKKRWFAHTRKKKGAIVIDDGCRDALVKKGRSILPVGVRDVKGSFEKGDSITVLDLSGSVIGVGLSNYSAKEATQYAGQKFKDEIIHRDNFVRSYNES
ncbi:MAG: glutamate 5-kinase [Fibrobacteres bacterium]|nr:glutamate 5-kinase [Fibrobacterota bacterium]